MDIIRAIEQQQIKQDVPEFNVGDNVKVHYRITEGNRERIQVFQGDVIRRQGASSRETFTVRKISFSIGVERTFPVHSPKIEKIEVMRRATSAAPSCTTCATRWARLPRSRRSPSGKVTAASGRRNCSTLRSPLAPILGPFSLAFAYRSTFSPPNGPIIGTRGLLAVLLRQPGCFAFALRAKRLYSPRSSAVRLGGFCYRRARARPRGRARKRRDVRAHGADGRRYKAAVAGGGCTGIRRARARARGRHAQGRARRRGAWLGRGSRPSRRNGRVWRRCTRSSVCSLKGAATA